MSGWNDDRAAVARAMWNEGKSAAEISVALGVTRNTIIGKLDRMGLLGQRRADQQAWDDMAGVGAQRVFDPSPPRTFSWEATA